MYYHDPFFSSLPFLLTPLAVVRIALYLASSWGIYSMTNNTGMKSTWMAWVPYAKDYLLGSLADRYHNTLHEKKTHFHLWLTLLGVTQAPLTVLSIMGFGVVLFLFSYAPTSIILLMVLSIFLIAAIELLYGLLYTIKMSKKGSHRVDGYFDFVVPPLEGLWEQTGIGKESFHWTSMLRLPEFVTREEFDWAVREATAKKKKDFSKVEFFTYDEGLCVQCMHLGSYDDEPETLARMNAFAAEQGYAVDFSETRFHHELYLSDPNRTAPEKRKTILRHPLKSSL